MTLAEVIRAALNAHLELESAHCDGAGPEPMEVGEYVAEAIAAWNTRPPAAPADLAALKNRIDNRLNNHLCDMKEGWDDSVSGFNDAWDIVRAVFAEAALAASAAGADVRAFEAGAEAMNLLCKASGVYDDANTDSPSIIAFFEKPEDRDAAIKAWTDWAMKPRATTTEVGNGN